MKDPNHAKGIMYLILFASFVPFGVGAAFMESMVWLSVILYAAGGALMIISLVYGIKNVRCPHCGKEFHIYGDRRRKYCSHECYIADRFKGGDGDE